VQRASQGKEWPNLLPNYFYFFSPIFLSGLEFDQSKSVFDKHFYHEFDFDQSPRLRELQNCKKVSKSLERKFILTAIRNSIHRQEIHK
jgi:hypothetical protein